MNQKGDKKNFLVIGGTGFIGSNLVRYLIRAGNAVSVYHRKDSNLRNLDGLSFESIVGDLADSKEGEKDLYRAMQDKDAVFNLAACGTSFKKDWCLREVINVEAARTVASIARQINNIRLVHISSSSAIGFPKNNEIADENYVFNAYDNHYSVTKRRGEEGVLKEVEKGLDAVIAIPCSTVGAHGMKAEQYNLFLSIARGKALVYPPGGLCLTNVSDLIRGFVLCYEKGIRGKRYILGGHNIKYKQYFDEIARVTAGKPPFVRLPKTLMPWLGLGVEILSNLLKRENVIDRHVGEIITKNVYYSSELAIKELGYTITGWKETIRGVVNELQEKGMI